MPALLPFSCDVSTILLFAITKVHSPQYDSPFVCHHTNIYIHIFNHNNNSPLPRPLVSVVACSIGSTVIKHDGSVVYTFASSL